MARTLDWYTVFILTEGIEILKFNSSQYIPTVDPSSVIEPYDVCHLSNLRFVVIWLENSSQSNMWFSCDSSASQVPVANFKIFHFN